MKVSLLYWMAFLLFIFTLCLANVVCAEPDRLTEEEIQFFVDNAELPPNLQGDVFDPFYGEKEVLFRRESGNARVTIFNGGHEIIFNAALHWLEQQKRQ